MNIFAEPSGEEIFPEQLDSVAPKLLNRIAKEIRSGRYKMGAQPIDEDLPGFLCVLLACKTLAACRENYERDAALRLLAAGYDEIRSWRFQESYEIAGDEEPRLVPEDDDERRPCPQNEHVVCGSGSVLN